MHFPGVLLTANSSRSLTAILEWRRRGDFFASGSSLLLPRKAFKSEAGPANERVPYQNIIYVLCRSSLRTRKGPRDVGNIFFSSFFQTKLIRQNPCLQTPPKPPSEEEANAQHFMFRQSYTTRRAALSKTWFELSLSLAAEESSLGGYSIKAPSSPVEPLWKTLGVKSIAGVRRFFFSETSQTIAEAPDLHIKNN